MPDQKQNASAIKVAVLLPSLQVGGAERLVLEELANLKDDPRFEFELHLVFDKGPFFQRFASLGVPVRVWNAPHKSVRMLADYVSLIRYLRKTRCQILHSHLLDGIGPIVGKLAGARVVATIHNDVRYSIIERLVLGRSDLTLGCGKQVVSNISRFIPPKKVALLNNAVGLPVRHSYNRDRVCVKYGIDSASKLLVSLGRLTRQKGFDVLVKAFSQVSAEVPEAVLLIGGDGEEKSTLETLARSSGCTDRIRLPGLIDDIHGLLSVCDVYVNSSRWEGLPMTLIEAMAHGRPMIATSVGGNPEVVKDGITGIEVPPENPKRLAEAIIMILRDDTFRERASTAARALFAESYSIEQHCAALKAYYLQLLPEVAV